MRTKTIAALTGGLLLAAGVAVALPASASTSAPGASTTATAPSRTSQQHREQRLAEDLAPLVSSGALTQAQADRVASTLAADRAGGHHGRGGKGGWGKAELEAAAALLGTTPQQLRTELRQPGATPASVAKAHGTSTDALVNALVGAEKAQLAERVEAGKITQAQADQRAARFRQHLLARLDQPLHAPHQHAAGAGA